MCLDKIIAILDRPHTKKHTETASKRIIILYALTMLFLLVDLLFMCHFRLRSLLMFLKKIVKGTRQDEIRDRLGPVQGNCNLCFGCLFRRLNVIGSYY